MFVWTPNQPNTILFVILDTTGLELPGLGATWTLRLSKLGGVFVVGGGVKSEVGNGWYKYVTTAAEANTKGPVAVFVTAPGALQQNLEYVVGVSGSGASGILPAVYQTSECYGGTYGLASGALPAAYQVSDCYDNTYDYGY